MINYLLDSAEEITKEISSYIDPNENVLLKNEAQALLSCLVFALVDLRDNHNQPLSQNTLYTHLLFENLNKVAHDPRLSKTSKDGLFSYLHSLPGYQEDQDPSDTLIDTHGNVQMFLMRTLNDMGHSGR